MYGPGNDIMLDTGNDFGRIIPTPNGDLPLPYLRSAPLFLHDLLDHNIGSEWPEYLSIDTDNSPWAKTYNSPDLSEYLVAPGGRKRYQTKHTLLQSGAQYGQLEKNVTFNSSCCLHCCHHFLIKVYSEKGEQSPCKCPAKTLQEGFHQLRFVYSYSSADIETRYTDRYRLITGARYACLDACGITVDVEVSRPRLDWHWVQMLTDKDRIMANLRKAKAEDPERFAEAQESWVDVGLAQLFTYAKDLVTKPEAKRLTKRNKRFAVVMGPELYDLFRWLGYHDSTQETDGVVEEFFLPTTPEPAAPTTKPGTYRAFIEDLQNELECLMRHVRMQQRDFAGLSGRLVIRNLEDMLHCDGFTFLENEIPLSWPYRFVGAMPNFSTRLLEDTYNRHCQFDAANKDCYTDALHQITSNPATNHGGHGPEFDRKVKGLVNGDMDYLLTTWDLGDLASDDDIIAAFQKAIREKPEQADTSFELLQTFINQARKSARLHRLLEYKMPFNLASNLLDLVDNDDDNMVIAKAQSRADIVKKETIARALLAIARDRQSSKLLLESKRIKLGMPPPSRPVGLENIGNTCYLNSILQYLYTLVPIQQLVNSYPSLALNENDIEGRLIGASKTKVKLLDLLVSQQFVKELDKLFQELQTVPVGPTQPTQALANTIVLSDTQLRKAPNDGSSAEAAIDLTGPSETFGRDIFMQDAPPQLLTPPLEPPQGTIHMSAVQPISDIEAAAHALPPPALDGISDVSSETLMGDVRTSDAKPIEIQDDTITLDMIEQTHLNAEQSLNRDELLKSLQAKHEFSMQQQDVEEIFGRIIDRIQAGIASTGSVYDDIQNDFVMQTLFFRMVTYTYKKDDNGKELPVKRDTPEFYRYITAFPAQSGPSTLYDALDRTFDREEIEGPPDMARYTAICDNPPPVLHILVQRTQDNGLKNDNAVILEDDLYLDRYMDAPEGSDLMKRRKESWALRKRLRTMASAYGNITRPTPNVPSLVLRDENVVMGNENSSGEDFEDLGRFALEQDGFPDAYDELKASEKQISNVGETPEILNQQMAALDDADAERIYQMFREEQKELSERNLALFKDMNQFRYRLHAIFCHSGRQSGGHYWVWIRDFKCNIWRKFNDTRVEEKADILEELNKGSEPYYLCYVLDKDQQAFVGTPVREPREEGLGNESRTFQELDDES